MKLFLASFLQKKNFGPGRLISVALGEKPSNLSVNDIFFPLTPSKELIAEYNSLAPADAKTAGENFISKFEKQMNDFCDSVLKDALQNKVTVESLLPFQDGDTLCSWERADFTNYRKLIAPQLKKLGYEVVLN